MSAAVAALFGNFVASRYSVVSSFEEWHVPTAESTVGSDDVFKVVRILWDSHL